MVDFDGETVNYVRNAVKATVDAYHGTVNMYVFEPSDPLIQAYRKLFPQLFQPASAMPPDIRRHARYPSAIFRAQAEIYRFYHMRDPQAFYNKEDVWDFAKTVYGKENRPTMIPPGHVVATLPGQTKEEFMLLLPFTPRGKDNLIGLMIARCDGENLGEIQVLQLSKQDLIFGPMQIQARINQEPEISKDLSLWDQKGSEVLHGQMLVLPVGKTFLYVEPIYIQASQGKMPQLKKVVVAVGNELFYRNTYEEAIAAMSGQRPVASEAAKTEAAAAPAAGQPDRRIGEIRERFRRYRELWSQGKYAEAGKEMEAIEALAGR
jgi:hypothetical protein